MLAAIKKILQISTPAQKLQQASVTPIISTTSPKTDKKDTPSLESQNNLRVAKLIMVSAQNNNKFYEMYERGDGTFTVNYGRVGSRSATTTYPIAKWDTKFREKTRKGYKDQTHLFATQSAVADFAKIDNQKTRDLIDDLLRFARRSVFMNYQVSSEEVTKKQVEKAQNMLNLLVQKVGMKMDTAAFNRGLIELYSIIPRKMTKVKNHLITKPKTAENLKEIENLLAEEQATLDVMRGQVELHEQQNNAPKNQPQQTLLEAAGMQIKPLEDQKLIKQIKKMMGDHAAQFKCAYQVVNQRTQKDFEEFVHDSTNQKTELFWHGSRNENWLSILKEGLVLRPANAVITGKMFGYGLYFADKFRKSLNYSSLRGSYWANGTANRGFLALYDVHVGQQFKIKKHESWCYQLSQENLKKQQKDADSLFAQGGVDLRNNEYIIYNHHQCTVRYLVEVE